MKKQLLIMAVCICFIISALSCTDGVEFATEKIVFKNVNVIPMNEAGLTPYQVLLTTTKNAAEMLGYEKRLGTIEKGKDADLMLLDKNPLEDIKNTKTIAGVMVKGVWLPKEQLQSMLAEVAERNK